VSVRSEHEHALAERIAARTARVAVIGQGYVGLPLAVELGRAGFAVLGLDSDPERVAALTMGRSHSPDVHAADLAALVAGGRYRATSSLEAIGASDVVLICVPTPLRKSKDPDISFVAAASEAVAAHVGRGVLVVLESTTYPGTTEEALAPLFAARGAVVGRDVFLAFSPERIDPGNARFKVGDIPKVVGGVTPACTRLAALLYRQIVPEVREVSSPTVAELAKLYENVFRNVNIALANELALMCGHLGVSTREVIDAAATKPFGFLAFYPGPGIGGHCIAVDPFYLSWKLRLRGYETRFIRVADEINAGMPRHVVGLVGAALNARRRAVNGARIHALGVAYKRGVGDTRESPALAVLAELARLGAELSYTDPHVPSIAVDGLALKSVELADAELAAVDCVVVLTDHAEFDYRRTVAVAPLVVDTRNATWGLPGADGRVVRL
jgi:UDP-N-acetyl-D-glucosamine dehydrogenase